MSETKTIFENNNYAITVGVPPKTSEFPEPFPVYLITNKSTGVLEYWHQVFPYAKLWANQFSDHIDGKQPREAIDPRFAAEQMEFDLNKIIN